MHLRAKIQNTKIFKKEAGKCSNLHWVVIKKWKSGPLRGLLLLKLTVYYTGSMVVSKLMFPFVTAPLTKLCPLVETRSRIREADESRLA